MIRKFIIMVSFASLAAGSAFAQSPAPKPAQATPGEAPIKAASIEQPRVSEDNKRDELSRKLLQRKQELNGERVREKRDFAPVTKPSTGNKEKK